MIPSASSLYASARWFQGPLAKIIMRTASPRLLWPPVNARRCRTTPAVVASVVVDLMLWQEVVGGGSAAVRRKVRNLYCAAGKHASSLTQSTRGTGEADTVRQQAWGNLRGGGRRRGDVIPFAVW